MEREKELERESERERERDREQEMNGRLWGGGGGLVRVAKTRREAWHLNQKYR